jgi:hypothetical protein
VKLVRIYNIYRSVVYRISPSIILYLQYTYFNIRLFRLYVGWHTSAAKLHLDTHGKNDVPRGFSFSFAFTRPWAIMVDSYVI